MRRRDAIVLVVLCGFALLSAGALRRGGSARVKALMCTVNMQKVGQGMAAYWDIYDGRMPSMNPYIVNGQWAFENCVRAHYVYSVYNPAASPKQVWVLLGCLFKAGVVTDGRMFYCPSTEGSMDEYALYTNPGPWGSNLDQQAPNVPGTGTIWLRATRGYVYWPQGRQMVPAGFRSPYDGQLLGFPNSVNGWGRYKAGYPAPPLKSADLGPGYAYAVDGEAQPDGAGGYKVNAIFPDGHTNYQPAPRDNGKWICPYQGSRPTGINPAEWHGDGMVWDSVTTISYYMFLLEP